MSKIKTYYHDTLVRRYPRTPTYRFTLAVRAGEIIDTAGRVGALRQSARHENAWRRIDRDTREAAGAPPLRQWKEQRVELKYRGPRRSSRYATPRADAVAVDVYLRERIVWASEGR